MFNGLQEDFYYRPADHQHTESKNTAFIIQIFSRFKLRPEREFLDIIGDDIGGLNAAGATGTVGGFLI